MAYDRNVDYRAVARRKARKYGLDPRIFVRQIGAESGFNPNARSPAGALGIAQIMPATARGWGVDPLRPRQALDAAAKNMAAYVRRYGSYENALRAYNAGPGAIEASRGYAETNAYVQKILRGEDPGRLGQPRRGGGSRGGSRRGGRGQGAALSPRPSLIAPAETGGLGVADMLAQMLTGQDRQAPPITTPTFANAAGPAYPRGFTPISSGVGVSPQLDVGALVAEIAGTSASPIARVNSPGPGSRPSAPLPSRQRRDRRPSRPRGPLLEMFYRGPGGINIDNGKVVGRDFVDGHESHVHVAANPREVVALGRLAQRMGLRVAENPRFSGVTPGAHVVNSLHYSRRAIDVSGGSPRLLRRFNRRVARMYGITR